MLSVNENIYEVIIFIMLDQKICCIKCTLFIFSLIRGSSIKDGRLPPAVNYIWPALVAAAPTIIVYFTNRGLYSSNGVQ